MTRSTSSVTGGPPSARCAQVAVFAGLTLAQNDIAPYAQPGEVQKCHSRRAQLKKVFDFIAEGLQVSLCPALDCLTAFSGERVRVDSLSRRD